MPNLVSAVDMGIGGEAGLLSPGSDMAHGQRLV